MNPPWSKGLPKAFRGGPEKPLLLLAFVAAMVTKQYQLVDRLGDALHRGGGRLCIATLGFLLVAVPWAATRRGRLQVLLFLAIDLAITAVTYGDLLYYRRFQDLTSISSLRFAGQLGHVKGSVFDLAQTGDILFAVDLVVLAAIALVPAGLLQRLAGPVRWRTVAACAVAGSLLVAGAADTPRLRKQFRGNAYLCGDLGLLGYHAKDVGSYVARLWSAAVPDPRAVEAATARFAAPAPGSDFAGLARGRNVIVVQLESFQGFAVGRDVDGQAVTPNLDALKSESVYFPNFFSQTGQGRTSDAEFLANCSLYPLRTGAVFFEATNAELRCLPTVLRERGYEAVVFHAAAQAFWNRGSFYPRIGYGRFYDETFFDRDQMVGLGLADTSFFRQTLAQLEKLPEPFYATTITLSSHDPFDQPGLPKTLKLGALEETPVGDYLHAVHYADFALGEFVAALKEKGILDDSILVVYGDHGAMNRANSNVGEVLGLQDDDLYRWTLEKNRVPLLIRLPGGAHAGVNEAVGGELDLAPTLASLLGLPRNETFFLGRDLLAKAPAHEPMAAFYNGSALTKDHLYVSADAELGGARCLAADGPRPLADCADLRKRVDADLAISSEMIERNLLHALRGGAAARGREAVVEGSAMEVQQ